MTSIRIPIPAVGFNPPVYACNRAAVPFQLDGNLDKPFWQNAPFTDDFLDIQGTHLPSPRFRTRAKLLWDDEHLYIGAQLDGDEIWGSVTQRDDVIFQDNDFEVFIDPDSDTQQYYELEMNVLNTVWDLFLPVAYRDNGSALHGYDIHGLRTAVFVDGAINQPSAANRSWSVEIVIPFAAITECLPRQQSPRAGDYYRVNFSRVHWNTDIVDGQYKKQTDPATGRALPEENWVWGPTGVINIHYPELWGFVFFVDSSQEASTVAIPEDEYYKWELRKLYYAQQIHLDLHGCYCDQLGKLKDILQAYAPSEENRSLQALPYVIETTSSTFVISCPAADRQRTILIYSNGKIEIK